MKRGSVHTTYSFSETMAKKFILILHPAEVSLSYFKFTYSRQDVYLVALKRITINRRVRVAFMVCGALLAPAAVNHKLTPTEL